MAALGAGIHESPHRFEDVDARVKPGHDAWGFPTTDKGKKSE
jgi:hypothetical protein